MRDNNKQNGFQAVLFLTPPKINPDSIQSTPSPMYQMDQNKILLGQMNNKNPLHYQMYQPIDFQNQHMQNTNQRQQESQQNYNSGKKMQNFPTAQYQNLYNSSYDKVHLSGLKSPPCNTSTSILHRLQQQSSCKCCGLQSSSHKKRGCDDDYMGNALLMGYGGIFLGKDLLSIIESNSSNSSPAAPRIEPKIERTPFINNVTMNNSNVLKNITNLEPNTCKATQQQEKLQFLQYNLDFSITPKVVQLSYQLPQLGKHVSQMDQFQENQSAMKENNINFVPSFKRENSLQDLNFQVTSHSVAGDQGDAQTTANNMKYRKKLLAANLQNNGCNTTTNQQKAQLLKNGSTTNTSQSSACAVNANFNFPDGGWVCSQCQNYNFSGRTKCNRCQKAKSKQDFNGKPKHLLKKQQQEEGVPQQLQNQQQMQPMQLQQHQASQPDVNYDCLQNENITPEQYNQMAIYDSYQALYNDATNSFSALSLQNQISNKENQSANTNSALIKKPLTERIGDWICLNCKNLNFSFRKNCNRCQLTRQQSGKMITQQEQLAMQQFSSSGSLCGDPVYLNNQQIFQTQNAYYPQQQVNYMYQQQQQQPGQVSYESPQVLSNQCISNQGSGNFSSANYLSNISSFNFTTAQDLMSFQNQQLAQEQSIFDSQQLQREGSLNLNSQNLYRQ